MKVLCVLFSLFYAVSVFAATLTGKVIKVYDADTIKVEDTDGGKFKIRLEGVDAPERLQFFGDVASDYTSKLVLNQMITVKFKTIDMYGRIVGIVYIEGKSTSKDRVCLNEELVKNGYAWWYSAYSKDVKLKHYEENARKNKSGLWKYPNPKAPWIYRKEQRLKNLKDTTRVKSADNFYVCEPES